MLTLEELGYYELSVEDRSILLLEYIQHLFDLDMILFKRQMEVYGNNDYEIKAIYKEHTGEDSVVRQIEKALAESYKAERLNKKNKAVIVSGYQDVDEFYEDFEKDEKE